MVVGRKKVKKTRKLRGHVSAGHGRVGKHRKHPGGRGMAGGFTHHRTWLQKYHPGYLGRIGMRKFGWHPHWGYCPAMNIDKLWAMVPEETRLYHKEHPETTPILDVTKHGYHKVLGKGRMFQQPLIVKAKFFTNKAERKIKEAGGCCLLTA